MRNERGLGRTLDRKISPPTGKKNQNLSIQIKKTDM
jgi:hypothetical protein